MSKVIRGFVLGAAMTLPAAAIAQGAVADDAEVPTGEATEMSAAQDLAPTAHETQTLETPAKAEAPAADAEPLAEVAEPEPAEAAPLETIPLQAAVPPPIPQGQEQRGSRLVEEIVVTAQKREENIQDVPIAISAFSPAMLDAVGVETVQDMERATPGLTITNAAAYSVAYLRGVGTDAFLAGADPSVPFYLDGVALLGTQGSADTLGRIKRVEVTKGPQGTLFGRNATGGAISIITPEPGTEFGGDLKVEFGNYNERNVVGYVDLPILESLSASLSGFNNERDNYYTNDYVAPDGSKTGVLDIESRGFRTKLRWDASSTFALTGSYSYAESSNNCGLTFENTRVAPVLGVLPILPEDPKADRRINYDQLAGCEVNSYLASVVGTWELPWLDLKMILSDQELDAPYVISDFDKGPFPAVSFTSIKQIGTQRTAELQFISNANTPGADDFEWVGGLYYFESDGGFDPLQFTVAPNFLNTLPIPGGATLATALDAVLGPLGLPSVSTGILLNSHGVSVAESVSIYFQGTYGVLDNLDLTVGARYQEEDRDLKNGRLDVGNADGSETNVRTDEVPTLKAEQLSPKVALQWRPFSELSQIYASWGRAYKSPTYNTVNFLNTPEAVDEEQVDSYELGFKSDLFDANLRLNAAAFFIEQKDLLTGFVALASGGIVTYANAGDAEIKGAEADFVWTPFPDWNQGLALTGAITYLDTEYTDYKDGRGFDEATGLAFGEGSLTLLPARDFTGNEVVRSPDLTYSIAFNQRVELGSSSSLEFGADVYHNSGFFFLPQNSDLYARESYELYNARVSYFYDAWGLQLTLFGENVTDEEYSETIFVDDFGRNQVLNNPRTYGLRAMWTF